jgi:hypothetical protein
MKKLMVCMLALTFLMGVGATAFAQDTMAPADKSAKAPLMKLTGTVKVDGDKVTFVNDKDMKSWDVKNPETLKAHDGHHVTLSAHVYSDTNTIHVMSVKMAKASAMSGDSMSK